MRNSGDVTPVSSEISGRSAALMGVAGFARERRRPPGRGPGQRAQMSWWSESGAAGLAAALSAASRGNQVIVIEKAPAIGGTTAKSDGAYWIPNNHIMRQAGIADPKDECDSLHGARVLSCAISGR